MVPSIFEQMKKLILFLLTLVFASDITAQQLFPIYRDPTKKGAEYMVQLDEITIVDKRIFENDLERYKYNQMRHYVEIIEPYLDEAVKMFYEIDHDLATLNGRNRRNYIKSKEKEVKAKFEDRLRDLNRTQGKYLVKAINRNLGKSCYHIIKEFKNPISAAYYRSSAALYGIDLDEEYEPEQNTDFERIMKKLGY